MIVKNEGHVLARCLRSVRPILSSWVIVDTGSTDDTEQVARKELADVPGEFVKERWVDFSTNRNQALALSRKRADYSLVIDADDELEIAPGFRTSELRLDAYLLQIMGDVSFVRRQLFKSTVDWRYEGVIHERSVAPRSTAEETLTGLLYRVHLWEGGRSRDPNKYLQDAKLLEQALREEPTNTRYAYYLAQSYHDHGDLQRALQAYRRRLTMGGDQDEIYRSLYGIAACLMVMGASLEETVGAFLRAQEFSPSRAEPLHAVAVLYRMTNEQVLAHRFAKLAVEIPRPSGNVDRLDEQVYAWRALEEYALASWAIGRTAEAVAADSRLVEEGRAPAISIANARHRLGLPAIDARFESCVHIEERF